MTQEKEYRVTDEDFDFIWRNINFPLTVRDRINVIKSRSTPALERQPCKYIAGNFCDSCIDSTCNFYPFDTLRDTAIRNEVTIDDFCICDIWAYFHDNRDPDDVSRCRGKECDYCGKFRARS